MQICREYLVGLLLETARKEIPRESISDAKRNLEMAAYFTHCEIQPVHKILTLRTAANLSFKNKQMQHCASFCRRCIELGIFFIILIEQFRMKCFLWFFKVQGPK
jgi:coatomer protein complex subunit alpha (xenin)